MVTNKKQVKTKRQLDAEALASSLAGNWEDAIAINDEILTRFPRNAEAMNRKGRALIEMRDLTGAREMYQEALKADPANMIARRNLQRLETLYNREGGEPEDAEPSTEMIPRASVFIEEIGKTWVDELANPADEGLLAEIAPGSALELRKEGDRLVIYGKGGDLRLGEIATGVADRVLTLIEAGNRYEVYALGQSGNSLRVIVREVYKDPSLGSRLSFPRQVARISELMRQRDQLFQRDSDDFSFGDDDEDIDEGALDEEDAVDEDTDDDDDSDDDTPEVYVDESMNDDEEEDEM